MKSSGTHSWVSRGSWKALTGIWLMRLRLSLRTCRVEPRWSRAPSSNTLILLLLRYLYIEKAHCDVRFPVSVPLELFYIIQSISPQNVFINTIFNMVFGIQLFDVKTCRHC